MFRRSILAAAVIISAFAWANTQPAYSTISSSPSDIERVSGLEDNKKKDGGTLIAQDDTVSPPSQEETGTTSARRDGGSVSDPGRTGTGTGLDHGSEGNTYERSSPGGTETEESDRLAPDDTSSTPEPEPTTPTTPPVPGPRS